MNVNYSRGSYAVQILTSFDSVTNKVMVHLSSEQYDPEIRYTVDSSVSLKNSPLYSSPFVLDSTARIRAVIFEGDSLMEKLADKNVFIHKAVGKTVLYETQWSYRYPSVSNNPLTDGLRGSERYNDGYWQGFQGDDLRITIDLGKVDTLRQVSAGFLQQNWGWVFLPAKVIIALSDDNQNWKEFEIKNTVSPRAEGVIFKDFTTDPGSLPARYIRVSAVNIGACPEWHPGAGDKAWIFADEIIIN
jgi:hexosaminidase